MARTCSVCASRSVARIDAGLLEGQSASHLARAFGVSRDAIGRHSKAGHAGPQAIVTASPVSVLPSTESRVLDQVRELGERSLAVLERAERAGSGALSLSAIAETRRSLELVAKLLGELSDRPPVQVNLYQAPEFRDHLHRLKDAILLEAGPDAAQRIAARLAQGLPEGDV